MSFVFATPDWVAAAATDLASIGSVINAASSAAAMPTSAVMAAGADDVSAAIATLFSTHAEAYQLLSQQAALFHQQFVELMSTGATQYANAETLNAALQQAGTAISAPLQALAGASGTGGTGGDAALGKGDEQVLLSTASGSYVQINTGGHGSGGLSAPGTGGPALASGAGSAGTGALLPSAGTGSAVPASAPAVTALPLAATTAAPAAALGADTGGIGGLSPVLSPGAVGTGAALAGAAPSGVGVGSAPASAGTGEPAGKEAPAGSGLRGTGGWLYGEHGLGGDTALLGGGAAGGNGGLGANGAAPLANGDGSFFAAAGGRGELGNPGPVAEGAREGV